MGKTISVHSWHWQGSTF